MNSRVWPPLASRTTRTRSRRPGRNRSWPARSRGPLGTSLMPVASTTMAPGRPRAKHSYHSRTSGVTNPSSLARHGTMAGTHVRWFSSRAPTRTGENRRERAASAAVGQRPPFGVCLMRSAGRHIRSSGELLPLSLRPSPADIGAPAGPVRAAPHHGKSPKAPARRLELRLSLQFQPLPALPSAQPPAPRS